MEAPERLWIDIHQDLSDSFLYAFAKNDNDSDIEYVQKDVFIEKACEFIKEHHHEFSFWNTEEYELGFSTQKFIEDFKKYMEG